MMTRIEALDYAVKLLDELAPRVNARGYAEGVIKPSERVTLVLRVAEWLLAGGESTGSGPPLCPSGNGHVTLADCEAAGCFE